MNKFEKVFRCGSEKDPVMAKYYRRSLGIKKTYAILMTPRSGSTWLTNTVAAYEIMSYPGEYFNAELFPESVKSNMSSNIYEYYDVVVEKMAASTGTFGFEISYFDLKEIEEETELLALMTGERYFIYLYRENFIAQAISMYLAKESGIFHITRDELTPVSHGIFSVPYNPEKIQFWASHILQQEYGIQTWLGKHSLDFLKICYEDMLADMPGVIQRLGAHLNIGINEKCQPDVPMPIRLASPQNLALEQQFREEHLEWCTFWESNRGREDCLFSLPWPFPSTPLANLSVSGSGIL